MRFPVRIRLVNSTLLKIRGFRYGALAVSLGVLGVGLRRLHVHLRRRREAKEEQDLHDAVDKMIDDQVCLCFEEAGEEEVENAFEPSAHVLKAFWGMQGK